jgi:hypothetical protein
MRAFWDIVSCSLIGVDHHIHTHHHKNLKSHIANFFHSQKHRMNTGLTKRGRMANTPALYLRGAGFKSQPGD